MACPPSIWRAYRPNTPKGTFMSGYSTLILNFLIDSHKNRFCLTEKQGAEYIDVGWDMVIVQFCCD